MVVSVDANTLPWSDKCKILSKEQHDFLLSIVTGKNVKAITELLNKEFDISLSENQVRNYMKRKRIKNQVDMRFKKGDVPINKGTKGLYNVGGNSTSFKKGIVPHNHVPIGSETFRDGYMWVKVSDEGSQWKRWKNKGRLVWEQNYGEIPRGSRILYIDGDTRNCDISNLYMVSNRELAVMNRLDVDWNDRDSILAIHNIAKIKIKFQEIKNKKRKTMK